MNGESIIAAVIVSMVALIMLIIGIYQVRTKDRPVGFYNTIAPPRKEEITDIDMWNQKHGAIWILYGLCIEICFIAGSFMSAEVMQAVFMIGGIIIPIPFMILIHNNLEKQYRIKK